MGWPDLLELLHIFAGRPQVQKGGPYQLWMPRQK
jgi:hypothetical protein